MLTISTLPLFPEKIWMNWSVDIKSWLHTPCPPTISLKCWIFRWKICGESSITSSWLLKNANKKQQMEKKVAKKRKVVSTFYWKTSIKWQSDSTKRIQKKKKVMEMKKEKEEMMIKFSQSDIQFEIYMKFIIIKRMNIYVYWVL